jgi:hypothetical protein
MDPFGLVRAIVRSTFVVAPLAIPDIVEKYSHLLVPVLLCGNPL